MIGKYAKALKGLFAVVTGDYRVVLTRESITIVDPRTGIDGGDIFALAGIRLYEEHRGERGWTEMLLSVLVSMEPVLRDDKRHGKTVAADRAEDDDICPIHGEDCPDRDDPMDPINWNPFASGPTGEA